MAEAGKAKKMMFERALKVKVQNWHERGAMTHVIYDSLIFKSIKEILGGRIRWFVSGGAPLS